MDWRCSNLCSWLIPSVTERSVLFVKELSFQQTAPTDDAFFQSDWIGEYWGRRAGDRTAAGLVCRLWIIGSEIGLWLGWSAGSGCGAPLQRQERRRVGGVSPVAAPMPKSVPR